MARLIDADALKAKANADPDSGEGFVWVQDIDEAPTVDAVPVVHGAWVNVAGCRTICNNCREYPLYDYFGRLKLSNSCPNCGAKMDLEVKDA